MVSLSGLLFVCFYDSGFLCRDMNDIEITVEKISLKLRDLSASAEY